MEADDMTAHELLPEDVRELIQRYIDTVAQLETLLFLRAHSEDGWDVSTIARRIYTSESEIARAVERLNTDGFLRCSAGRYTFECSDELRRKVDRLEAAYQKFLIPITRLIHHNLRPFPDTRCSRTDD
jgi:DNA-binding MarR family transcriptional regulator